MRIPVLLVEKSKTFFVVEYSDGHSVTFELIAKKDSDVAYTRITDDKVLSYGAGTKREAYQAFVTLKGQINDSIKAHSASQDELLSAFVAPPPVRKSEPVQQPVKPVATKVQSASVVPAGSVFAENPIPEAPLPAIAVKKSKKSLPVQAENVTVEEELKNIPVAKKFNAKQFIKQHKKNLSLGAFTLVMMPIVIFGGLRINEMLNNTSSSAPTVSAPQTPVNAPDISTTPAFAENPVRKQGNVPPNVSAQNVDYAAALSRLSEAISAGKEVTPEILEAFPEPMRESILANIANRKAEAEKPSSEPKGVLNIPTGTGSAKPVNDRNGISDLPSSPRSQAGLVVIPMPMATKGIETEGELKSFLYSNGKK